MPSHPPIERAREPVLRPPASAGGRAGGRVGRLGLRPQGAPLARLVLALHDAEPAEVHDREGELRLRVPLQRRLEALRSEYPFRTDRFASLYMTGYTDRKWIDGLFSNWRVASEYAAKQSAKLAARGGDPLLS